MANIDHAPSRTMLNLLHVLPAFADEAELRLNAIIELNSMTINKYRLLREILKQERLMPQSINFQMAWLVAFNDGLLQHDELDQIPQRLKSLETQLKHSALTLDSPRQHWLDAVTMWLNTPSRLTTEKKAPA